MSADILRRVAPTYKPYTPNGVFVLTEFADINDQKRQRHWSGGAAQEFRRMTEEAGFDFKDCWAECLFSVPGLTKFIPSSVATDWSKSNPFIKPSYQPHVDFVKQVIYDSGCTLIIACGDLSLFVLTGQKSVATWRGSCLYTTINDRQIKVIPTYNPSNVLKVWDWRHISVYDLRRAWAEHTTAQYYTPDYNWIIKPTWTEVTDVLCYLEDEVAHQPVLISNDIETINRYISCTGIAWSKTDAICIPLMTREEDTPETPHAYWSKAQEAEFWQRHNALLTHPNARVVGQNYLYDAQHIAYEMGIMPNVHMDTMLAWHTLFPGEKKSLDFLASIMCDNYVYWKDELKDYNRYPDDELTYWRYNCKDVCYTYEIATQLPELLEMAGQTEQYNFQMGMYSPVFTAMLRGVRIDTALRSELSLQLMNVAAELETKLLDMSGNYKPEGSKATTYWFNSPQQCQSFFYDYLGLPKQFNRKTGGVSTDDNSLSKLAEKEPIISPIVQTIQELRSVNIFRKNFVEAPLGPDKRIRCSYNLAGTETFRLASSKDAFGQGANLQTIPSGNTK